MDRCLEGGQCRKRSSPVEPVTLDTSLHLFVGRKGGGDKDCGASRLSQPVGSPGLGAARFAAALATEDQFVPRH
jgi:hypothetical protein